MGQDPEVCVLLPLINGTDGTKMSKSKGNCVFLDDPDIEGRIMSITDEVMDEWIPIFTEGIPPKHPKERKEWLAKQIKNQL